MKRFLLLGLIGLWCLAIKAQPTVVLPEGFQSLRLSQEVRVWVTPDSAVDVRKVLQLDLEKDFQPPPAGGLMFPFQKRSYWLAFKVENQSQFRQFILEVSNLSLYDLRLFRKMGDSLTLVGQGGYRLEKKPKRDAVFYNFEILLENDGTVGEFYLFANTGRTGTGVFLPMRLVEADQFLEIAAQKRWVEGILTGAGLFIILFGWGLHRANRTKSSAWLLVFMLFWILYVSLRSGVFHRICWEQVHEFTRLFITLSGNIFQTAGVVLFIHFNQLKDTAPRLSLFIKISLGFGWLVFLFQSKRYFFDTDLSDGFINAVQYLYFPLPLAIVLGSLWQTYRLRNKKYLVFPTVFLSQILTGYWHISLNLGYHNYGLFYRDIIINITFLIDFMIFLAWFSYELILLKTDHARQQLALAEARTQALENLMHGQQEERRRLRFRLHDGLGILLANLRMRASKLARQNEAWRPIETDIALAAREARLLSHDLEPEALREGHLREAMEDSVGRIRQLVGDGVKVDLQFPSDFDKQKINPAIVGTAYYIAQELLLNAHKHAGASEINLSFEILKETILVIRLEDNGKGLATDAPLTGIGIENIRSRVAAAQGTFVMKNKAEGGLASEVNLHLG